MAILNIVPSPGAEISPQQEVSFTIDPTYTSVVIKVSTNTGLETAYDTSLGGTQGGYSVQIQGGLPQTWFITRNSGWNDITQLIQVVEDESGSPTTTDITYNLVGEDQYPEGTNPYNSTAGQQASTNFLDLVDTPNDYAGFGLDVVIVGAAENALEFTDPLNIGRKTFLLLDDTPSDYTGLTGYIPQIAATEDQLEFVREPLRGPFGGVAQERTAPSWDGTTGNLQRDEEWVRYFERNANERELILDRPATPGFVALRMQAFNGFTVPGPGAGYGKIYVGATSPTTLVWSGDDNDPATVATIDFYNLNGSIPYSNNLRTGGMTMNNDFQYGTHQGVANTLRITAGGAGAVGSSILLRGRTGSAPGTAGNTTMGRIWMNRNVSPPRLAWFTQDGGSNDLAHVSDIGGGPALPYEFSTTTTMADPGSGIVRFNNADAGLVSQIAISNTDDEGHGVRAILGDATAGPAGILVPGSQIIVVDEGTPGSKARFWVTGVTDNTTWTLIDVDNTKDSQSSAWALPANTGIVDLHLYSPGAETPAITAQDEGTPVANTPHGTFNFVGAGVTATDGGSGVLTVTIPGGGSGVTVEDENTAIPNTPHTILNFTGAGVVATDAGAGQANITISGGGGGVTLEEEGTTVTGGPHTTLDFTGSGENVTVTDAGSAEATINIINGPQFMEDEGANTENLVRFGRTGTPATTGATTDLITNGSNWVNGGNTRWYINPHGPIDATYNSTAYFGGAGGGVVYEDGSQAFWDTYTGDMTIEVVCNGQNASETQYLVWIGGAPNVATAADDALLAIGTDGSGTWRAVWEYSGGNAVVANGVATWDRSRGDIHEQMVHVAATRETSAGDTTISLYINGTLIAQTTQVSQSPTAASNAQVVVGNADTAGGTVYEWVGQIRDVRISSVSKTEAQLRAAAKRALGR